MLIPVGMVIFGNYLDLLVEYLPQLDRLVYKLAMGLRYEDDLPLVLSRKWAEFCRLHHLILLIFSSISSDFR